MCVCACVCVYARVRQRIFETRRYVDGEGQGEWHAGNERSMDIEREKERKIERESFAKRALMYAQN